MIWQEIFNSTLVENLGWTLLHSVWQIALITLALFSALKILTKSAANSRYLVSLFALVLSLAQGKKLRDEPKVSAEVWKTWEETKTKK